MSPPEDLATVELSEAGEIAHARVSGEVDIGNADEVLLALTAISNEARGMVLDLTPIKYLDSSGLRMLHELHHRLAVRSQRLVVVSEAGQPPRRMLSLTALDTIIAVSDSPADAAQRILSQ